MKEVLKALLFWLPLVSLAAGAVWGIAYLKWDLDAQRSEHQIFLEEHKKFTNQEHMRFHEAMEDQAHEHFEGDLRRIEEGQKQIQTDVKDLLRHEHQRQRDNNNPP